MNIKGTILDDFSKNVGDEYVVLNQNLVSDGLGGQTFTYSEGLEFQATLVLNTSLQGEIAQKQGVTGIYTVAYPKSLELPPRTIFKRKKDNKIFRTTDIGNISTPSISSLDMSVTRAEDYILPSN